MKTIEGKIFTMRPSAEVLDYMRQRTIEKIVASPKDILIKENGHYFVVVRSLSHREIPARTTFIKKILKWGSLPENLQEKISAELFILLINEILHSIKAWEIVLVIEDGEAKTVTSKKYSEISNLEVYKAIEKMNITKISHNDYITRFYTERKAEAEPIVNDFCGFGYDIINSETGFAALSINHFILRYVCRNGATVPVSLNSFKQEHYNVDKNHLLNYIKNQIENADSSRNTIVTAIKRTSQERASSLKPGLTSKLGYILSYGEKNKLIENMDWNGSKYDIFNYITHNAKTFDIIKRYQFEKLAGEIILN